MSEPNSFCGKCGGKLDPHNNFCPKCGSSALSDSPNKETIRKKRVPKKTTKLWYVLPVFLGLIGGIIAYFILRNSDKRKAKNCLIIGIALFAFYILVTGAMISSGSRSLEEAERTRAIGSDNVRDDNLGKTFNWDESPELQQNVLFETEYSWMHGGFSSNELLRNPENYVGKTINLRGEVFQVQKVNDNEYHALVHTDCENFTGHLLCTDGLVWVNYSDLRIIKGDLLNIWGESKGLKDYETTRGNLATVPEIDASGISITPKK